jgi:hypothetical protein
MLVVLNPDGYFISQLHEVTQEDIDRSGAIEAPDADGLTSAWRLVDGAWVQPVIEPLPPGGVSQPVPR